MKQTYLDIIRKAVYEKCPELLEPTFGFRFMNENHRHRVVGVDNRIYGMDLDGVELNEEYDPEKHEIIGHPILPHHILKTLGEDWAIDGVGWIWKIDQGYKGMDYTRFYDSSFIKYNLDLPLEEQSEETLQFLAENLGPN